MTVVGKGARARKQHEQENKPALRALATAARFDRKARTFGILMLIAWAIILVMQIVTQSTMHGNLNSGVYAKESAEEIARLTSALPMGAIGVTMISIGLLSHFVLTTLKKPLIALIGWGLALAGAAFFVMFFIEIQALFPYVEREVNGTTIGRGLDFTTMLIRYYSAAVPLLLPAPSLIFALRAKKYREIADVMTSAAQTESTLSLGDEE